MVNLDCNNSVYDNLIEYYFHEYFENRSIDLTGLNYKQIPNSTYEAAFLYIYKKLFKPDTKQRYNTKTLINIRDPQEVINVFEIFKSICKEYNIIAFKQFFCDLTGISLDTLNSWKREEYNHEGLSSIYSDIVNNLDILPGQQVKNKLGDDKIGIQSLANNDSEVGLLYARQEAFNKTIGENAGRVSLGDLQNGFKQLTQNEN